MNESFYLGESTAIINFSVDYYKTCEELVSSEGFKVFLTNFLKDLQHRDGKTYNWLTHNKEVEALVPDLITLAKLLLVLEVEELNDTYYAQMEVANVLYIVENAYNYWRKKQRFSIIDATSTTLSFNSFIDADSAYSQLVLTLYRTLEEKLQGKKNIVYRQLQAGTNACALLKKYKWSTPANYNVLKDVPFVNKVMLRTPIIFHPACNKRTGTFMEVPDNPIDDFACNTSDWYCMPIKVNDLLCFVYFHKDYMLNGLSLANLFEVADEHECVDRKPDLICLFGKQDGKEDCTFYHDITNNIYVGTVSYHAKAEYFGYIKKAVLTLHNLAKMERNCLPIHGSMMEIYFKDGSKKSLVLIGDSGAGKSESIEAVKMLAAKSNDGKDVMRIDVVFDDMGSMKIVDNHVVANGTETGAFVRLDDLDNSTAYQDMERSIFLNPESDNARVILPIATYDLIASNHEIDMVLYANNYEDKIGVERFENYEDGKQVFIDGKRWALGTTQEKGLSTTFFANPFGPMQKQEQCTQIMEEVFGQLYKDNVYVGQIFTNLGTEHKENISLSAKALLELLQK